MRRVMILVSLLAACLAAHPVPAAAQDDTREPDTQIADWVFHLPAAMRVTTSNRGGPALTFRATPDNLSTTVLFTHSEDLAGDDVKQAFRDWAREGREALRRSLGIEVDGDVTETRTAAGYEMIAWAAPYTDQRGVSWVTILSCLRRGRRAGGTMLFTNDFERLAGVANELDGLLDTATFASRRPKGAAPPRLRIHIDPTSTPSFLWDPPPEPPRGGAGLDGIYGATGLGAAADPREGITTARFRWSYYTFLPDGRVLRELPPEGLLAFRFEFWAERFARDAGTYVLRDDVVELSFPGSSGRAAKQRLARRGADLVDGGTVYAPLATDAVALRGTFRRHDHASLAPSGRLGITFSGDGRFQDEGFSSAVNVGWWVGGDCVLRDLEPRACGGTWRTARNTLELVYDDGRRRRFAFHRYGDEPAEAPRIVVVNGNVLVRTD